MGEPTNLQNENPNVIVPLESILCTEELRNRPWRAPDYAKENRALVTLAAAFSESPQTILETLAKTILEVTDSDSSGVSLLTPDEKRFYWPALAGSWTPHVGGGTPRDFGPCGDVLDRNMPLLMRHWEWRYTYFLPISPPVVEGLLVPFYVGGKAVGTIWVVVHGDRRKFDAEDERLLVSLGKVASLAYQLKFQMAERAKAETALQELNNELEARVRARTEELEQRNKEIKKLRDKLHEENIALREEIDQTSMFEEIVGTSSALQAVLSRVSQVASADATVLITGETGTGKELIARAIHRKSQRSGRPFITINCAAVPQSLITSELFGHEKGAFTGALQRRRGRFELADGGTIFLDEIGELPMETQVALLRVLQEREFERVGGNERIRVDVRVVAATNRDLIASIASGAFRNDLFYRLNVFPIEIPPLRERQEDVITLMKYFIDRYANNLGKKIRAIDKKTVALLQSYPWPGNVRELQNVIERSVITSNTDTFVVDERWVSRESDTPSSGSHILSKEIVDHEKEMIEAALKETKGRISGAKGAAIKLGIPSSTLESKIKALKINKHRFK